MRIPHFKGKWEEEYRKCSYQPSIFLACCWISTAYLIVKGTKGVVDEKHPCKIWSALTWSPYFITSALYFFCVLIIRNRSPFVKEFCIKYYSNFCEITTFAIQFTIIVPKVVIELRRTIFEPQSGHLTWDVDFSHFPPARICTDHNPIKTWREPKIPELNLQNAGCNNMILWGGFICEYIVVSLYPILFRMSPRSSLILSTLGFAVLVISLLSVGTKLLLLFFAIALHLAVTLCNFVLCTSREKASREQFCVAKATKMLASKRLRLLNTLIPSNVVMKLASHQGRGMPAANIPHCTVMFCLLEPPTVSQTAASEQQFDLLNDVFSEFDDIVERFGMFKYHHVGDSYVVACPRAACPFDAEEQAAPYPAQYSVDMVLLGDELQRAAERHELWDGHRLTLRVGIACGPAAGCVLGSHRSFYCIVGNTVNTASRMCKYAREAVHTTAEFAAIIRREEVGPHAFFFLERFPPYPSRCFCSLRLDLSLP